MTNKNISNSNGSFIQQAHHIIPVESLRGYEEKIQQLFNLKDTRDFQQMGSNFIYLYSEKEGRHEFADRAKELLKGDKNIFGDIPVGGVNHSGGHTNYNEAVKRMLGRIFTEESNPNIQRMMILDLQRGLREMLIEGVPDSILKNETNEKVEKTIIDELNKRTYSPDTKAEYKDARKKSAEKLMDKFVDKDGNFIYDDNKFEHRVFDGGSGKDGRSTDALAKYTAEKIYQPMKNLNDIVGFLSEQSTKKFSNYAEKDPSKIQEIDDGTGGTKSDVSRARQVIFSITYDVERFMAGQNALDNINPNPELRDRIDRFYADFARAVQLSTSYDANLADIDRILNDLATRQEDIKIAQMLRDLNNNKPITVDVDDDKNNGDKSNFKDSKLAQVIDAVGASGKFDNAKINGIKVSEYKKSAESSGKPYVDLNTAIHQSATDKQFFNKLVSDTVQTRASGILDMASKTMGFQGFSFPRRSFSHLIS